MMTVGLSPSFFALQLTRLRYVEVCWVLASSSNTLHFHVAAGTGFVSPDDLPQSDEEEEAAPTYVRRCT